MSGHFGSGVSVPKCLGAEVPGHLSQHRQGNGRKDATLCNEKYLITNFCLSFIHGEDRRMANLKSTRAAKNTLKENVKVIRLIQFSKYNIYDHLVAKQ